MTLLESYVGKLHHHIVALQVSEGTAVRKLEAANAKIKKLEAQILRLQRHLDERAQSLYHCQVDARNKARHLKRTIQVIGQSSGLVPWARLHSITLEDTRRLTIFTSSLDFVKCWCGRKQNGCYTTAWAVYELGAAAKAMAGLLHLHTNTGMWLISSAYKSVACIVFQVSRNQTTSPL